MRHVVIVPVLRGSFVLVRDLAPRHRTGLDGIVPEGMRAIRVTVTGALRPRTGSAVDVLASFDARSTEATSDLSTVVVAAGVRVLGSDTTCKWGHRSRRRAGCHRARRSRRGRTSRRRAGERGAHAFTGPTGGGGVDVHGAPVAALGSMFVANSPCDHPRNRAGALGVPPDLLERSSSPRSRPVRLERLRRQRLAGEVVRRRTAPRHTDRGALVLPSRPAGLRTRGVAFDPRARHRHHGERGSPGCCFSPRFPAPSSVLHSRARSKKSSATRS